MLVCWGCCVRLHVPPTVTHAHTHTDGPCHCLSWLLVWSQLWKHWPTTVLQRTCVWMGSSAAALMHLCGAILGQQWVMFLQISTLKRIAGSLCNQRYSLCLPNIIFFFFCWNASFGLWHNGEMTCLTDCILSCLLASPVFMREGSLCFIRAQTTFLSTALQQRESWFFTVFTVICW